MLRMPRPLDWVPSFKLKVGLLVVGAAWGLVFEYHKGPEKH